MARSDGFSGLSEFLSVAKHASFRAAAAELGVTPAAVSQAIRTLETKTGLVLFQRTTRRVGLTEAGEQLLARVRPAAAEIAGAFAALTDLRDWRRALMERPHSATHLMQCSTTLRAVGARTSHRSRAIVGPPLSQYQASGCLA